MSATADLTPTELLAKYGLKDPLANAQTFAKQVNQLAIARKAVLHCKCEYQQGEFVQVRYTIWGTDSQGLAWSTTDSSPIRVLTATIRELNKRYARRQGATEFVKKHR